MFDLVSGMQVTCTGLANYNLQTAVDIGFRNPPAEGPNNINAMPYPIWCAGSDGGLGLTQHGQGTGCIEMRYLGVYMSWCSQSWNPVWRSYYSVT